jgi:adenylosuccinate lyase
MSDCGLLGSVFFRHWLHQPALELWSDRAVIRAWVQVEQALARAQARLRMIPEGAAKAIELIDIDQIDWRALERDIAHQMHPFTPVLHQLETLCGEDAAGYLHWGATTQNIFDTASALQMKSTLHIVFDKLDQTLHALGQLALQHALTPQAGRTHGQHALPISFGLKLAGWHAEIARHVERIRASAECDLVAVMGGGVGSFSAMQGRGREVQAEVANLLGLADAGVPSRSMGDRFAHLASLLALLGNTVEKIAREIVFLQRTEVSEANEAHHDGKMGSSTMAQKRNPSQAMNLIGLAYRIRYSSQLVQDAMVCENEGFAALSNVIDSSLVEVAVCAASLADGLARLCLGLQVNTEAMRKNLQMNHGLIMSEALMMRLAAKIGRHVAHQVLYEVTRRVLDAGQSLQIALREHPAVKPWMPELELDALLDPASYLGEAQALVHQQVGHLASEAS